ncbi:MAG: hypothetical protein U1F05_12370 [Burkholderiales bacterium]
MTTGRGLKAHLSKVNFLRFTREALLNARFFGKSCKLQNEQVNGMIFGQRSGGVSQCCRRTCRQDRRCGARQRQFGGHFLQSRPQLQHAGFGRANQRPGNGDHHCGRARPRAGWVPPSLSCRRKHFHDLVPEARAGVLQQLDQLLGLLVGALGPKS